MDNTQTSEKMPRRCRFDCWPEHDRTAWTLSCTPSRKLSEQRYGATLREASLAIANKTYGCWLAFLDERGWLDPDLPALERVTPRRLRAWFYAMLDAGHADATIIGQFDSLTMALKILSPGQDVSWIRRPDGASIYSLLPKLQRAILVPDNAVLQAWACELMNEADSAPNSRDRLIAYRDGLFLAMFASRARRLRSMALLRVGYELVLRGGRYRIELRPDQVKTGKADHFDLPDDLTPYIRHYLGVVRPQLLKRCAHDALWVALHGGPLTAKGIQHQVFKRSRARFGQSFGPHRFRHSLATSAALYLPGNPGLAAAMLGISADIVEQNYRRTGQVEAAMSYADLIERKSQRHLHL